MKNNIAWVDLVRVVACLLVVVSHCCDPFVGRLESNYGEFLSGSIWGSMVRSCVPLFAMISAVLLLPVKMDMGTFYRKRLMRVVVPLVVWSLISPLIFYFYSNSGVVTPHLGVQTWEQTMNQMLTFVFNFNASTVPLWYLYMLVGLYLVMPIVSAWLVQASAKDIRKVLYIWIFATTIPYIQMAAPMLGYGGIYGNMGLLGICDWNPYGTFYYFSGFIGYMILAYYLVRYPLEWSWRKTLGVAIPMWITGFAITIGGYIATLHYFPGNMVRLETIWLFSGINVLMMTFPVFIVLQKIPVRPSKFLRKMAGLTFGIYLCHYIIVQICYDFLYPVIDIPAYMLIPLIVVVTFWGSAAVTWILSLLPKSKYIIG